MMLIFAGALCTYAQTEITGTVVDETGEAAIGATVKEKGTANGTVTDFDGNFKLKVQPGATLTISYIGYEPIDVIASDGMTVTLKEDATVLNEVVVTGYQVQRKADLTGAVSVVSVGELQKQNENNPMKALQGRVPGMNISADGNPRVPQPCASVVTARSTTTTRSTSSTVCPRRPACTSSTATTSSRYRC